MKVIVREEAKKQIKKLTKVEAKKVITKIEKLSLNQYSEKFLRGDFEGLMSLRAWPYRIIYRCDGETLIIFSVAHRKEVYKK